MSDRTIRIIGILAILWNLGGVASYLGHVGMFGTNAAAPPPGAVPMPDAVTAAFAIAVFSGLAGAVSLFVRSRWAAPLLWLSFVASVINWAWVFRFGEGVVALGVAVVVIALVLAVIATRMRARSADQALR